MIFKTQKYDPNKTYYLRSLVTGCIQLITRIKKLTETPRYNDRHKYESSNGEFDENGVGWSRSDEKCFQVYETYEEAERANKH